jgi:hypothetical protein
MVKPAVLFLVLGLVVGLWLGFNPQAHRQTIQKWDSAKTAYLKIKAETTAKIQGLNSHLSFSPQSSPKSSSAPQSQPAVSTAWKQVSTSFEVIWNSMQRFWANATAKISTTR